MEHEPHHVAPDLGWIGAGRQHQGDEAGGDPVGGHEIPQAVDDVGRERLVPLEQPIEHAMNLGELRVVGAPFAVGRRETGTVEQLVALTKGHVECRSQVNHHLP